MSAADDDRKHRSLFETYERLFLADDAEKDVTFRCAQGRVLKAHRFMLKAASEVFAGMFNSPMRESQDGEISLPDVDTKAMKVFLRLLYTGHVDPADWGASASDGTPVMRPTSGAERIKGGRGYHLQGAVLTSSLPDFHSYALYASVGPNVGIEVSASDFPNGQAQAMIGIAPQDTTNDLSSIYTNKGFYVKLFSGGVPSLYAQDGTSNKGLGLPALRATDRVAIHYHEGVFTVAVNGCEPVVAEFHSPIPAGDYCPAINLSASGMTVRTLQIGPTGASVACPSAIAITVCVLAQKYLAQGIYLQAVEAIKECIRASKCKQDVDAFQEILATAAAENLLTIVIAAMDAARTFPKLKEAYDVGSLREDVAKLLQAIWPASSDAVAGQMEARWW